jgi:transcriptional regulator with XRE-family HTH domain
MPTDRQLFTERLRTAVRRAGLTQSDLADRLEISQSTVSDWFNVGAMPGGEILLLLPEVLDVNGHWLLTGEGRPGTRTGGDSGKVGNEAVELAYRAGIEEARRTLEDLAHRDEARITASVAVRALQQVGEEKKRQKKAQRRSS